MAIELDHIILAVGDTARSIDFYTRIVGLTYEGDSQPFSTLRVTPQFVILLAQSQTSGGEHLAFAMTQPEFEAAFARVRVAGVPYGDRFDSVGSMRGPSDETGARGIGKAVYFFDPDRHLLEIRYYETPPLTDGAQATHLLDVASVAAGSAAVGSAAIGALAIGAAAFGGVALGVAAIGLVTLWQVRIGEANVERLTIGELTVAKLQVLEST